MRTQRFELGFLILAAATSAAGCTHEDRDGHRPVSYETALRQYQSCNDLESDLKQVLIAEAEARLDQMEKMKDYGGLPVAGAEDGAANPASDNGGSREEGKDYSGTNNQEEGVDEADFVKTDGYRVYVLNGNRLHIFGVPQFGDLDPISEVEIEGWPREMLQHREAAKVAVFSQIDVYSLPEPHPLRQAVGRNVDERGWWWRSANVSKVTIVDVSDAADPKVERELYFEGWYQTARLVEASVRMGLYSWTYIPGVDDYYYYWDQPEKSLEQRKAEARAAILALDLDDIIPRLYERKPDRTFRTIGYTEDQCRSFARPTDSHGRGITSILSFDLFANNLSIDADHILSNWSTIYASKDHLYVAEPANDWWWFWWNEEDQDLLNIHAFDIRTPGETRYLGSGRVDGYLLNQFSLGEHEGFLRVATTTNRWARWWTLEEGEEPPPPENHVFVLALDQGKLETVGRLSGIARGERIFSARFVGDKGYVVTFQNIDPLFTIDLSNPYAPRLAGELEVPGFSTYIHPIAEGKLLTIGVGGDETGANWRTQISLFDVADFANPKLADVEELVMEGQWGWSEAMYEHKAFQYWAPKKLLAVPLSRSGWVEDGMGGRYDYVSRLELVTVDPQTGLSRYGSIDHSSFYPSDQYWYYLDIRRSIFMGDFLYAISDRGVTVHKTADLSLVRQQPLPGYSPDDYYWWW